MPKINCIRQRQASDAATLAAADAREKNALNVLDFWLDFFA